jgi:exosortase A-associated hydrolase 1
MTRRHFIFLCEGDKLAATLDTGKRNVGLLMVSGGNETRAGAFSGMAELAARIASAGYPVFRFDRRGVGDSEGENRGFQHSEADIHAALEAFQTEAPHLKRIYAFGNCDGASALVLAALADIDGLILANPWVIEDGDAPPPPTAIRARYMEKLRSPRELLRLLSGQVSFTKLARGLRQAIQPAPSPGSLGQLFRERLARATRPVRILLAERDRTAQIFLAGWDKNDPRIVHCSGASHAFVEPAAREWIFQQILAALPDE